MIHIPLYNGYIVVYEWVYNNIVLVKNVVKKGSTMTP